MAVAFGLLGKPLVTTIPNGRRGNPTPLVVTLVALFAVACGGKKSALDAGNGSGGAAGGMAGSADAGAPGAGAAGGGVAGSSGAGGGGPAGGGGGGSAGAASGGGAGGDTTSAPDAGQSNDGGLDAVATFSCSPDQPDGGWSWDGPPPPSTECVRGQQFCDNAKCYDLESVHCAQQPTCLCVDHGYINCHCRDDGHGAVTHLGCDPI